MTQVNKVRDSTNDTHLKLNRSPSLDRCRLPPMVKATPKTQESFCSIAKEGNKFNSHAIFDCPPNPVLK